jgi:ATP-dependent Clp protease ATP-binding subunit ClpC
VFERFTDRSRRALVLAQEEARRLNHSFIGTEHLLLGLIAEHEGVAAAALESFGISLAMTRTRVEELTGRSAAVPSHSPSMTPRAKKVFELSFRESLAMGHSSIGTEHLLLGLIQEGEGVAFQVLHSFVGDVRRVRQKVVELLSGHQTMQPGGGSTSGRSPVEPRCTECHSQLSETARFRSITVPPQSPSPFPMTVEVVYCNQCGFVFGTFKVDTAQ